MTPKSFTEPQHLIYYPLYQQAHSIFKKQLIATDILNTQELKKVLEDRKISPLEFKFIYKPDVVFMSVLMAASFIMFVPFGGQFVDPGPHQIRLSQDRYVKNWWFIDRTTNQILLEDVKLLTNFQQASEFSARDFGFPTSITYLAMAIIVSSIATVCFQNVWEEIKRRKANREIEHRHQKIEATLAQLSFVGDSETEEAPSRDVGIAFPYLPAEQLSKLTFRQLQAAREHWPALFQKRLRTSLYSKHQLAIWYLFEHLIKANKDQRQEILENKISQELIGSEPLCFQLLVSQIQPLNQKISKIFQRILKHKILKKKVSAALTDQDFSDIFKALSAGQELSQLVRMKISRQSRLVNIEDDYERFLSRGHLTIESLEDSYLYFKRSLKEQHVELANWFASFLAKNLDFFASHPHLGEMIEELYALNAHAFILKIDQHLQTLWQKPSIDFAEMERNYVFAKKHGLTAFTKALQEAYTSTLNAYTLAPDAPALAQAAKSWQQQFEKLFEDRGEPFLQILENKFKKVISAHPEIIEELANAAMSNEDLWLLDLIKKIYESNPTLYATYWLSPLEEVVSI